MKLDRSNIEEWLLLYADDELTTAERQAVESFLEGHPDLRFDLEMMREIRLLPQEEPAPLWMKQLLRPANELSREETESLLDFVDGEADELKKRALDEKIKSDPFWQASYQILSRTLILPDKGVSFPSKQKLYRSETRTVRISSFRFLLQAAAVILFFLSIAGWYRFGRNHEVQVKKDQQPEKTYMHQPNNENSVVMPEKKEIPNALQKTARPRTELSAVQHEIRKQKNSNTILLTHNEASDRGVSLEKDSGLYAAETMTNAFVKSSENEHSAAEIAEENDNAVSDIVEKELIGNKETEKISNFPDAPLKEKMTYRLLKQFKSSFRKKLHDIAGEEPIRVGFVQIRYNP